MTHAFYDAECSCGREILYELTIGEAGEGTHFIRVRCRICGEINIATWSESTAHATDENAGDLWRPAKEVFHFPEDVRLRG